MVVTFCGHGDTQSDPAIMEWLSETITKQIKRGANLFYLGGYGGSRHGMGAETGIPRNIIGACFALSGSESGRLPLRRNYLPAAGDHTPAICDLPAQSMDGGSVGHRDRLRKP